MKQIVAYDPIHEVNTGTFIEGPNELTKLERRGVVVMPISDAFGYGAIDGFCKREWGAGWTYDGMSGKRGCPMVMAVKAEHRCIYWAARLVPIDPNDNMAGKLKLTTDTSDQRMLNGGMRAATLAIDLDQLGPPDVKGGWNIGARCELNLTIEGMMGLNIWGTAKNVRVLWSAVTQCDAVVAILGDITP